MTYLTTESLKEKKYISIKSDINNNDKIAHNKTMQRVDYI